MSTRWRLKIGVILAALSLAWLGTAPVSASAASQSTNAGASLSSGMAFLADVTPGVYRIKNRYWGGGQCLTAQPRTSPNWGIATFSACDTAGVNSAQAWIIAPHLNYSNPWREVRNIIVSGCLDAQSIGIGKLTRHISMFNCNNSPNQAWAFRMPAFNNNNNPGIHVCTAAAALCDYVWDLTQINSNVAIHLAYAERGNDSQDFYLEKLG